MGSFMSKQNLWKHWKLQVMEIQFMATVVPKGAEQVRTLRLLNDFSARDNTSLDVNCVNLIRDNRDINPEFHKSPRQSYSNVLALEHPTSHSRNIPDTRLCSLCLRGSAFSPRSDDGLRHRKTPNPQNTSCFQDGSPAFRVKKGSRQRCKKAFVVTTSGRSSHEIGE